MTTKATVVEDTTFLLYAVPLITGSTYGAILWFQSGASISIPPDVYLTVTKDPILFLVGVAAVCAAVLVDMLGSQASGRKARLQENSLRVRLLAYIITLSSMFFAWSAASYSTDLVQAMSLFIAGRYSIIQPLLLIIVSLLISPRFVFDKKKTAIILSPVITVASPIVLFMAVKGGLAWSMALAASLGVLALGAAVAAVAEKLWRS